MIFILIHTFFGAKALLMTEPEKHNNTNYYDAVADAYNEQQRREDSNELVRSKVSNFFRQQVPSGRVLDFGGGTGLDLPWMIEQGYDIVFCEPSQKMRAFAIRCVHEIKSEKRVTFLSGTDTDFASRLSEGPPFPPVDGILANFAVLNNIENTNTLFHQLALVLKPGCHLVTNVLDAELGNQNWRNVRRVVNTLFNRSTRIVNSYQGAQQSIFLHPVAKLQKAASSSFTLQDNIYLGGYGFRLLHFVRNDD